MGVAAVVVREVVEGVMVSVGVTEGEAKPGGGFCWAMEMERLFIRTTVWQSWWGWRERACRKRGVAR